MQKLVQGIHHFQANIFRSQRELFERLADGQQPEALFITCSDSRINPNLITQTEPGDLFILRNAGNIVPPYGAANGGEAATIEYRRRRPGRRGHHRLRPLALRRHEGACCTRSSSTDMPAVTAWLAHAEATRRIMREKYRDLEDERLLTATVEENVLVQLENLRTHPAVAAALASGRLQAARLGLQDRDRRGVRLRPEQRPVRSR